ncbi:MAG: hypothetical protein WC968_01305 [Bacilli bacterium]
MPLADINISVDNDECIAKLKEKGYFDDDKTTAKFAASYALSRVDLSQYKPLDEYKGSFKNNKWHMEDFDGDKFFRTLIRLYHDDVKDEDYALRAVISIGLDKILDIINNNKDWTIVDII